MMMQKLKKNHWNDKANRLLITVNVLGGTGPLRFVVKEEELVSAVIAIVLKSYAREGCLPILGTDLNNVLLFCVNNAGTDALSPCETIGSCGGRNFVLCKKEQLQIETTKADCGLAKTKMIPLKSCGSWKEWLKKPLSFKISA
uniref:DUF7054 domain-containing protein n=1 Tax=Nelumbo nucifera TaxID=4432 RepID=A0A822YUC9_NELNU|nr:TPA_asm: hypothetical protein HUJ06_006353 [Nelumbo nucifera]